MTYTYTFDTTIYSYILFFTGDVMIWTNKTILLKMWENKCLMLEYKDVSGTMIVTNCVGIIYPTEVMNTFVSTWSVFNYSDIEHKLTDEGKSMIDKTHYSPLNWL